MNIEAEPSFDIVKRRRRRDPTQNIEHNVNLLLMKIYNGEITFFAAAPKRYRKESRHNSNRHSRFTGVSRNGNYWQVLKNIGKTKKYLGGFPTEIEAALVYDFYSMAIDLADAKTNFNYTAEIAVKMAHHYLDNGMKMDMKAFIPIIAPLL